MLWSLCVLKRESKRRVADSEKIEVTFLMWIHVCFPALLSFFLPIQMCSICGRAGHNKNNRRYHPLRKLDTEGPTDALSDFTFCVLAPYDRSVFAGTDAESQLDVPSELGVCKVRPGIIGPCPEWTIDFTGTTQEQAISLILDCFKDEFARRRIGDNVYFEGMFRATGTQTWFVRLGN
jgi:hypothetical protein